MDRIVLKIIEQARSGEHLSRDEIAWLLSFPEESPESLLVVKEAKRLAWERCRGRAFVHAQIGLDSLRCPGNCRYCSFAQVNDSNSRECSVMDMDALLAFARLFSQEGANLISLMSTAALPFEKLLSFVAAARLVIDDHVILLVNGPDLSLEQAIELREAGADAAYHAVRLGEGYLTDLDPRRRVQTIENIQAAGLALMSGVEPLWRNAPEDELLDAIERQIGLRPVWTGCCSLTIAENCSIHGLKPASRSRARQVALSFVLLPVLAYLLAASAALRGLMQGPTPECAGGAHIMSPCAGTCEKLDAIWKKTDGLLQAKMNPGHIACGA